MQSVCVWKQDLKKIEKNWLNRYTIHIYEIIPNMEKLDREKASSLKLQESIVMRWNWPRKVFKTQRKKNTPSHSIYHKTWWESPFSLPPRVTKVQKQEEVLQWFCCTVYLERCSCTLVKPDLVINTAIWASQSYASRFGVTSWAIYPGTRGCLMLCHSSPCLKPCFTLPCLVLFV